MRLNFAPEDFVGIAKRRFFWAAIPFLIVGIAGFFWLKSLPALYESTATLIVEDQQISNAYVRSAVASDALQRVETLRARVMARDNLLFIAEDMDIIRDNTLTGTERADRLRNRTRIGVNRVTQGRRATDPSAITVTIAFRDPSPALAQRVTNRLLTDFINRSVETRAEQAEGTTVFLSEQEQAARRQLDDVINQISRIKQENPQALPENREIYSRALDRLAGEQGRIDTAVEQARQELRILQAGRPIYLNAQGGQSTAEQELRNKRRELEALERQYQPNYPDVRAVKEELLDLERELDPRAFRDRAREEIEFLSSEIENADPGSVEYDRLTARKAELEEQRRNTSAGGSSTSLTEFQYNTQIQRLETQIAAMEKQKEGISAEISETESRLAAIPAVEGQLYRLEREREQLENDFARRRADRASAELSEAMEEQSMAERLSILEQPVRPDNPVSPNKPRLAMMIIAGAGAVALIFGLFWEVFFPKVRTAKHIRELIPESRIIEVPRFKTAGTRIQNLTAFSIASVVTLALGLGFAWSFLSAIA